MKKIRKVLKLKYDSGLSLREIGRAINISKSVAGEYIAIFRALKVSYEEIMKMSDQDIADIFQDNKKENSEKYTQLYDELPHILKKFQFTGMTKQYAWQEYIKKYPDGYGYSRFCHHLQIWEEANNVSMKQHHKPGDKLFVDYTGKKLSYVDPKTKDNITVEVFVAVLGASGFTYAEASMSQKQEDFVRSTERAFRYLGGVPNAIVPDNLKSAVVKADKYDPIINPLYDDFAEYYRTIVLPARAYKPKDKSLVENGVRLTYQRIFAPLWDSTFYSLKELNKAIKDLLDAHNDRKLTILDISRRELFNELEKDKLKLLPSEQYPIKYFEERKVAPDYHILLSKDKSYYSVPWQLKGEKVRVIFDDRNVAIYHKGERVVQHIRSKKRGLYTTLDSHMPKNHQFYASWSDEKFLNWAKDIGFETERVISHLLTSKRHSQQAYKTCVGILSQSKSVSNEVLNIACRKAWNFNRINSRDIREYAAEIKAQQLSTETDSKISQFPKHSNLRGNSQYK